MRKLVRDAIGAIILETEDEQGDPMLIHLLKLEEATRFIPRKNLEWVMPTELGIKWRTKDGATYSKDFW